MMKYWINYLNNWKVLNELSAKLLAENELDAEALQPYLERVSIPKWMSKVNLIDDVHIDDSPVPDQASLEVEPENTPTPSN